MISPQGCNFWMGGLAYDNLELYTTIYFVKIGLLVVEIQTE